MNNFTLMSNALISAIDSKSISVREHKKPLLNTLKTQVKVQPGQTFGSNTLFGKTFVFDIPKNYDGLAQLGIKATITVDETTSNVETYLSAHIFDQISLRTKSGNVLQTIYPHYTDMRVDEVRNTPLQEHLNLSMEPDFSTTTTSAVYVPLFFFFSEETGEFLKTRHLEELELYCNVVGDETFLGIGDDLEVISVTAMSFELICTYFDNPRTSLNDNLIMSKKYTPGPLYGTYNVFNEDAVALPTGSTSARLLIRCPHPAFNISMSLVDLFSIRVQINTMKITLAGGTTLVDLDYKYVYSLFSPRDGFMPAGTLTYYFSKEKDRTVDSGLMTFNGTNYPCYVDITFDALEDDYTLHTFLEYRTNFHVNELGQIGLSNDQLLEPKDQHIHILQSLNSDNPGTRN